MDSVPFLTSLIAIVWLVLWFLRNDKRPANEPMDGIFALRQSARLKPTKAKIGARPSSAGKAAASPMASARRQDQRSSGIGPRPERRE